MEQPNPPKLLDRVRQTIWRHHLHESGLQKAIKLAVRPAKLDGDSPRARLRQQTSFDSLT
jgi:hypothetical protein